MTQVSAIILSYFHLLWFRCIFIDTYVIISHKMSALTLSLWTQYVLKQLFISVGSCVQ